MPRTELIGPPRVPLAKDFDEVLDVTYRHMMFQKSLRYWEGRWIIEVQKLNDGLVNTNKGLAGVGARFKRWCMLTPCLIVTSHSMPKHFRHSDKHTSGKWVSTFMLDFIDLLIFRLLNA